MSTFVLIPGGWHGGWYFQSFADALRAHGHRAYPVTLTGIGERRHLLHRAINLDSHIDDVVQLIEMEQLTDIILLAHSYGGMVQRGVIDRVPGKIAAAIYSDAYVPEDGQSCFDLAGDVYRQLFLDGAAHDGFSVQPPPQLDPRASAHPFASFLQRLRLVNPPPAIRRGYIYLSGWPNTPFTPLYERLRNDPAWQTFSLPVGHNVIRDAFDDLLKIALTFA